MVVTEPVAIFEILSDSTADNDIFLENAEYRATPSVQRYVILQQTHPGASIFIRIGEDWVTELVSDDGTIRVPEIGVQFPLAALYEGLE